MNHPVDIPSRDDQDHATAPAASGGHPQGDRHVAPRWMWLSLVGPVFWWVYFWVVDLAEGAECAANTGALVGWVMTGLVGLTMVVVALDARGSHIEPDASMVGVGLLLGASLVVATVFVGVPAVILLPC